MTSVPAAEEPEAQATPVARLQGAATGDRIFRLVLTLAALGIPTLLMFLVWELVKGSGCPECNFTGYRGRAMVGELWVPTSDDGVLIAKEVPMDELVAQTKSSTNIEELVRVMPFGAVREMLEAAPSANAAMAG